MTTGNWLTLLGLFVGLTAQGMALGWFLAAKFGKLRAKISSFEQKIESITQRCEERGKMHDKHFVSSEFVNKTLENHGVRLNHVEGRVDKLEGICKE